ncbi:META domain-containing protein [Maribacter cobaltidurans]|uniref:Uncharacterized protein n=1 Tax=Maribacter cobaltidurans TaxID=1178778 RepID=A0A223V7B4_9FLAO|nr:META domain-containing protein [Maribacter cobaltidurans]ASV31097.1 hypothetical protein CJ263_13230 [Maribacter cobaltidurans]GGD95066.1 hypothetical protein GCM10011412_36460 [Maribacter cobaltidurans]
MNKRASFKMGLWALLTFFVSLGCSKDDDISYDLVGSWKVTYYITAGDLSITKEQNPTWPEVNGGEITATFGEPGDGGEGILSGFTVSNSYTGSYTAKKNGELSIGPVATTLINEPEWTSLYNISAAQEYEVKGDELFIYYNDRTDAIVFERN